MRTILEEATQILQGIVLVTMVIYQSSVNPLNVYIECDISPSKNLKLHVTVF